MDSSESAAKELGTRLQDAGVIFAMRRDGPHSVIEVATSSGRVARVFCFWYERHLAGLVLGMTPGNSRTTLRAPRNAYVGPEYLVQLVRDGARVADGRAHDVHAAALAVRLWTSGASQAEVEQGAPFVGERTSWPHWRPSSSPLRRAPSPPGSTRAQA